MTTTFQGYDGEMRIIEHGVTSPTTSTGYLEILFCEMDFNGPISRPKRVETLILNRGRFDTDAHYIEGSDEDLFAPLTFTVSCRLADTVHTTVLHELISGVTKLSGVTQLYSWKGLTKIGGVTTPPFKDTDKFAYRVELKWDGSTDYGFRYEEVYFQPGQQTVAESANAVMLNMTGLIYGDVTRISAFTSGVTSLV